MMPSYVYVAAQDDNQIAVFTIDGETGRLTRTAEVPMPAGRPCWRSVQTGKASTWGIARSRKSPAIASIPPRGPSRAPAVSRRPTPRAFWPPTVSGRYLLAAYYQGGRVAVHPLGEDGAIGDPPSAWVPTAVGAHAIQTDPSNRFAFVPHIARLNDNVLEPPKNTPGPT